MARSEADKEDLLAEVRALSPRGRFQHVDNGQNVVVGFFGDGRGAIYFDGDRMYQSDPEGRLRRAYVNPFLYVTQCTTLARLHRHRTGTETVLSRTVLTPEELRAVFDEVQQFIGAFLDDRRRGAQRLVEQISADQDFGPRLERWLDDVFLQSKLGHLASSIRHRR